MSRYKCKKPFTVPKYDDNGFFVENDVINIEVDTIFEVSETENLFVAAKPAIRLENSSCWIEIQPETLELYFEKVSNEDKEREKMTDNVNHPSHYETGKFECIDVMIETQGIDAVLDFCICNAFKYLYRHKNKNGVEDIKKAKWYIDKYIELRSEKQ